MSTIFGAFILFLDLQLVLYRVIKILLHQPLGAGLRFYVV